MQDNFNRLNISSHHDELANATIQRLGRLIGTLLELLVVRRLLNQVENLVRQAGIGQGESFGVNRVGRHDLTRGSLV